MKVDIQKINSGYKALLLAAKNTVPQKDYQVIKRALDLAVEASGSTDHCR
jgi:hypothetical protein